MMSEPTAYQQEAPVCPRHPARVSYVRCQRCGRPVCPDCQRPAAVGVQCVDCVREQAGTVRTPRTQFGGSVATGRPMVTLTLVGICVVVWLLQQVSGQVTRELMFAPVLGAAQPWRFLTAAFVHGPILHIGVNMYSLWIIGQYLEPLLGRARYLAIYLISAVGGSVGYLLLTSPPSGPYDNQSGWLVPTVGASGAIFGLFVGLLVLNRHLGRSSAGIVAVLVINVVLGFVLPGIAWQAHIGGAVTGAACAGVLALTSAKDRRRWQVPGLVAVTAVVVAAAVLRYAAAGLPIGY